MRDHRPKAALDLLESNMSGQIRQRAMALSELNQQVKALLPAQSAAQCRVANYREGVLILECGSSAWATRLNYDRYTLLSALRQGPLPTLTTIDIKINPELAKTPRKEKKPDSSPPARHLSPVAAQYLEAIAEGASDSVRKRLEAIAALAKEKP